MWEAKIEKKVTKDLSAFSGRFFVKILSNSLTKSEIEGNTAIDILKKENLAHQRYRWGGSEGSKAITYKLTDIGFNAGPRITNEIMQLDITTLGNAYHFGDLVVAGTNARNVGGTTSNKIR